jgi:hypothetical protein
MSSRMCCALLAAALFVAPTQVSAQGRVDSGNRGEAVVITVASVRVRTAPSISSLSIDEFAQGSVFPLAGEEYQTTDWLGVIVDGRIAYVPRFAAALRQRAAEAAPSSSTAAQGAVMQSGAPASAPAATLAARPRTAERVPAPVAAAPAPAVELAASATPAPAQAARATPPAPPVVAEVDHRADRPDAAAAERTADAPVFKPRRAGLNLSAGVLGSASVIETFGLPRAVHVSGASFIGVRYRILGLYAAPGMGQGGGFRSTSLDGGASLELIHLHLLRITALGGYLRHSETTMPEDSTVAPVTRSLDGYTMGGMVSIPFVGPLRLAYRGQYDTVRDAGIPVHRVKHSVGLVF